MFTFQLMEDIGNLSSKGDGLHLMQARDCSDTQNERVLGGKEFSRAASGAAEESRTSLDLDGHKRLQLGMPRFTRRQNMQNVHMLKSGQTFGL